jgi:rRNA biogenesis protein RRP5
VLGHNDGHFNTRSKKKKGKHSVVDEDDFFSSLSAMDTMPKFVELLKFKYLKSGMKLWGMITEIRATEMTISLAHGLKGRVLLENASDSIPRGAGVTGAGSNVSFHLNTYFSLGSYVRCSIVKVTGKQDNQNRRSIDLSTRVSDVNKGLRSDALCEGTCISGCVKSVEDHGYLIDFGIKGTSGFLKKNQCPKNLLQGSNVDVVVSNIKRDGCAIVSADPQEVDSCVTKEWSGIDVNSLLPGSLVNVKVRHVLSDGLAVSFLTFFNGTIDQFHLDKPLSNFKEGQTMKARILWCNSDDKKVSLSMLPHLISRSLPSLPSQGEIFETAIVTRVDPGLGIALNLPSKAKENDSFWKAYAHISNLSDKKVEDIQRRFKLGQLVPCRVIGLRPIDGLASVSLKPSVIEGTLVDISEIKPGLRVTGIVEKVDETCLKLRLSPHLRAHVPALHFSDAAHKKAHKKFKEGQVVNGKVLEVDRDKKKIIVTLKQTLLESKYPMLTSLEDASTGIRSHGVITGMQEKGVFVTFFNNFFGFIGKDHLGLKTSQSPQDAFTVGQVVKARVTGINSRSKTLRLSLLSKKQVAENAIRADTLSGIQPGQIVHGEIKDILKAKQADARVNGYIIKLDSADGKEILAKLDVVHLADHPVACQAFVDTLQVGSRLKNLVVLEKLDSIQQVRVTNKSSIRDAIVAGKMPENIDNLKVGSVIPGFVASVTANAVYVRFLNRVTGRAPLSQISDSFVSDPNSLFHIGMSVRAAISHVDLEKETVGISLKESLCSQPNGVFIQSLFTDLERAIMYDEDALQLDWASDLMPGSMGKFSPALCL